MLDRLAGLETEYAIRFSPAHPDQRRPDNQTTYQAVAEAVRVLVQTLPGNRRYSHEQLFTANGGGLYFERSPGNPDGGLIEASTPECRGPGQLLLYQRAQELLLTRALPRAEEGLRHRGHPGALGLLKNGRDAEGNVYGVQENFEAELATGGVLTLYRVVLALLVPVMLLDVLLCWALLIALAVLFIAVAFAVMLIDTLQARIRKLDRPDVFTLMMRDPDRRFEKALARLAGWLDMLVVMPAVLPFAWLLRLCAFRPIRRATAAFFASRPVVTGTGTVEPDGRFLLSEKAPSIRRLMRSSAAPTGRAIFDTGNLLKGLQRLFVFDLPGLAALFDTRQRMQLGLSDANRCQVAEYLKLGSTLLVLDMAEAGALDDAPRLRRPVRALHTITDDPTLEAAVPVRGGAPMTGLQIQRWYCERARRWLAEAPTASMEAHDVVRLWSEALDALERDPGGLVGRLDWVTKRYLIEQAAADGTWATRKKVDLSYHELVDGPVQRMEAAGIAPVLVSDPEAAAAIEEPPAATPARQRGRLVRELADDETPATIGWGEARIGEGLARKIVRLDAFRARRAAREEER